MNSLIYNAGTVSVSGGSAIVTGNLTGWAVALVEGGVFSCDGLSIPILSVEDDTHLTLAYAWPGAAGSGKQYAIARTPSEATARAATWTVDRLGKLAQTPWGVGVVPDGRGTLAQRNALNPMPNDDYCWLRVEVDQPLEYYFRVSGQWLGPYVLKGDASDVPGPPGQPGDGFEPAGAWAIDTTYSKNDLVWFGSRSFVSQADGNIGHEPPDSDTDDAWWQFVPAAVGPANVLTIGDVTEGPADAEITGTSPSQQLNLTLPRGLPGLDGDDGWTPVFAVVADGARYVQQVVDWTGGTGAKPVTGQYVGPAGFVSSIGDAVNIRGASGSGTGDVVGPSSAVDGEMALFDGTTGKLVKGGGAPFSGSYSDLSDKPTLGTAAAADASDFATTAQGENADAAFRFIRLLNAAGEDLDAVVDVGWYAMNTNAGATAGTNYPVPQAGVLQVIPSPANNIDVIQRYTTYRSNGGVVYQRVRSSGGSVIWGVWKREVTDDMTVTTSADGLMSAADKAKLNGIAAGAQVNLPVGTGSGTVAAGDDSRITGAVQTSRSVATQHSLQGGGNLSANRTLSLVGDVASPGNNKVYGTDASGAKGWKDDPAGVELGDTWQNVSGARSIGTSYQNTTGKYIGVNVTALPGAGGNAQPALQVSADNSTWISVDRGQDGTDFLHGSALVPPGYYYRVNVGASIAIWSELR